jgi:hypothetical protein
MNERVIIDLTNDGFKPFHEKCERDLTAISRHRKPLLAIQERARNRPVHHRRSFE